MKTNKKYLALALVTVLTVAGVSLGALSMAQTVATLQCSSNVSSVAINQAEVLTATGGNGFYAWSAEPDGRERDRQSVCGELFELGRLSDHGVERRHDRDVQRECFAERHFDECVILFPRDAERRVGSDGQRFGDGRRWYLCLVFS